MEEPVFMRMVGYELKDLRKGAGAAGDARLDKNTGLGFISGGDPAELRRLICEFALTMADQQRLVVLNALKIPNPLDRQVVASADDLTSRRAWFSSHYGIPERTLMRHEDAALDRLAELIAARYAASYELPARSSGLPTRLKRKKPVARSEASKPQAEQADIPDDIPGILNYQNRKAQQLVDRMGELASELSALSEELRDVREANRKLARTWGIELEG